MRTPLLAIAASLLLCGVGVGDVINEDFKLLASDGEAWDRFGYCVSISSDTALIGTIGNDDNGTYSGSAYIYRFNGSSWIEEAELPTSDGAGDVDLAQSVSISGDRALIGAHWDDYNGSSTGSAYVYRFDGSQWVEEAKLLASDGAARNYFGYSVSIFGDMALVGAPRHGNDTGSTYVYRFNGSDWIEEAKLLASDTAAGDYFGISVSFDGNVAVIGAYGDDNNSGSAYVFRFNGSTWIEEAKLLASDGAEYDHFGSSVSISGDTILVGAGYADGKGGDNSGSAYVFRFDGSQWIEEAQLLASDGEEYDNFGVSVSISGDTALIGAKHDDYNGTGSGSAYVFHLVSEDCDGDINGDGTVNVDDLLAVIAGWGDPYNVDDLLLVIGDWGPCP